MRSSAAVRGRRREASPTGALLALLPSGYGAADRRSRRFGRFSSRRLRYAPHAPCGNDRRNVRRPRRFVDDGACVSYAVGRGPLPADLDLLPSLRPAAQRIRNAQDLWGKVGRRYASDDRLRCHGGHLKSRGRFSYSMPPGHPRSEGRHSPLRGIAVPVLVTSPAGALPSRAADDSTHSSGTFIGGHFPLTSTFDGRRTDG